MFPCTYKISVSIFLSELVLVFLHRYYVVTNLIKDHRKTMQMVKRDRKPTQFTSVDLLLGYVTSVNFENYCTAFLLFRRDRSRTRLLPTTFFIRTWHFKQTANQPIASNKSPAILP